MRRAFALAALPLLVVACAPAPPVAQGALPARAETSFEVRTLAMAPSGVDLEVRGIDCVAEAEGFRLAFRSPATVAVPDLGPSSPPVLVRCAGGGRSGEQTALPRPAGAARAYDVYPTIGIGVGYGSGGGWGWGNGTSVGVGLGTNIAPRTVGTGATRYSDVRVVLR
jgi:hypothetical protein